MMFYYLAAFISAVGFAILDICYGYRAVAKDDKWIHLADQVGTDFAAAVQPGSWLVDLFPICMQIFHQVVYPST